MNKTKPRKELAVTPPPEYDPDLAEVLSSREARRAMRPRQSLVAVLQDHGRGAKALHVLTGDKGLIATLRFVCDELKHFSEEPTHNFHARQQAKCAWHDLVSVLYELEDIRATAAARVAVAFDESFIGHSAIQHIRATAASYRSTHTAESAGNASAA